MERFNGTLCRVCLDSEIFTRFAVARIVIAAWSRKYNSKRPHSSIGYITPEMALEPDGIVGNDKTIARI
jgi:putative transposase